MDPISGLNAMEESEILPTCWRSNSNRPALSPLLYELSRLLMKQNDGLQATVTRVTVVAGYWLKDWGSIVCRYSSLLRCYRLWDVTWHPTE